jgi:serine protease Do
VVLKILNKSPLTNKLSLNDIILEIQKKEVDTNSIETVVANIIKTGEKTILLTVINQENQRRYVGVKVN